MQVNRQGAAPYLAYFVGAAAGVLWPYMRKYLEFGVAFDWRAIVGKVVVALFGLLLMPTVGQVFEQLGGVGWLVAFGMGIGATMIGHEGQGTPGAIKAWRNEQG